MHGFLYNQGLKNQQDIEELIQEIYVEAYKALPSLENPAAAKSWLFTIARRQFIRHLEKKKALPKKTVSVEACEIESHEQGADQLMHSNYILQVVHRQIESIGDRDKARAMNLFFIELEPLPSISKKLGVNISTLTTWCSRFRSELKDKLKRADQNGSADEAVAKKNFKRSRLAV